jgi:hypothetical protein
MRNEIRGFEPTMSAKRTLTCLRSASQQASEANNFSPCSLAVEPAVATLSPTLLSGGFGSMRLVRGSRAPWFHVHILAAVPIAQY